MTYTIAETVRRHSKTMPCIEDLPGRLHIRGRSMLYIHPDEWSTAVLRAGLARSRTIYYEEDVPEQWSQYTRQRDSSLNRSGGGRKSARPTTTQSSRSKPQGEGIAADAAGGGRRLDAFPGNHGDATAMPSRTRAASSDLSVGTSVARLRRFNRTSWPRPAPNRATPPAGTPELRESGSPPLSRRFRITG